ncbi:hypothetical protein DV451_001205 [Geotrichum candidum]|uniref:Uncharacterized protein n=1 Tax=Geotrichum candidum TaxID=1173061 RepID=A0A9P5G9F8_GEOCN|nr:hypothetical protein DV451_001205 [Geotrichum candidum]KAF5106986.1 hypothetical protein DV453_003476 [Geotrichum candidum]
MAFWRIGNGFSTTSAIDKLLDKEDHTLIDILEEPDILTELSTPNTRLVEYLREPEIMHQLVGLVTDLSLAPHNDLTSEETTDVSKPESDTPPKEAISIVSSLKSTDTNLDNNENNDNYDDTTKPEPTSQDNDSNENDNVTTLDESSSLSHPNLEDEYGDNDGSYFDEDSRHLFADIACEILSADIWSITEALMESTTFIEEIWSILDYPAPLSLAHSSHFTKINEHLLDKKTEELTAFIKSQENFVARFMRHIDNPPVMDFLLKVISSDKPDNPTGTIEFLQKQKLIPSLISFLGPDYTSSVHSAAGDFLKAFVTISANSNSDNTTIGPNELSRELVSEPCVNELVRLMLFGGSGLSTGVGVVIEIIRKNNSDYDFVPVLYITIESHPPTPRDPIYLGTLVKIFSDNIPKFNEMLTRKHNEILKTPFGQIEPLGFERFKICELVAELLHCSNMVLLNDEKGESIVKARDEERIRVQKEIDENAEAVSENADADVSEADPENIDAPESAAVVEDPVPVTDSLATPTSEDITNAMEASESCDTLDTPDANKSDETSEADADVSGGSVEPLATDMGSLSLEKPAEGEATENEGVPTEESFRVNPVIGDKFKIALADNQVVIHILNMFFQFPWNNFLHNVVFDIVQQIFNGPMTQGYNRYLAIDLFKTGQLTHLICKGQTDCAEYQKTHKCRLGYMGHLTLISEEVVKFTSTYPPETVSPIVEEAVQDSEWVFYVTDTLTKSREQYGSVLGGMISSDGNGSIPDIEAGEIERNDQIEHEDEDMQDIEGSEDRKEGEPDVSGQFFRYVSQQMTVGSQFGSSDEDDEDEDYDLNVNNDQQESSDTTVQLLGASDGHDDEDEDDDSGLDLVRSKSIHNN